MVFVRESGICNSVRRQNNPTRDGVRRLMKHYTQHSFLVIRWTCSSFRLSEWVSEWCFVLLGFESTVVDYCQFGYVLFHFFWCGVGNRDGFVLVFGNIKLYVRTMLRDEIKGLYFGVVLPYYVGLPLVVTSRGVSVWYYSETFRCLCSWSVLTVGMVFN